MEILIYTFIHLIYIYMCIYIYVSVYVYIYTYTYPYTYTYTSWYIYVYIYVSVYVYIYTYTYPYTYTYTSIYIYNTYVHDLIVRVDCLRDFNWFYPYYAFSGPAIPLYLQIEFQENIDHHVLALSGASKAIEVRLLKMTKSLTLR